MKLLLTLVLVCLIASNALIAQIIEQPFEMEGEEFGFYDFNVHNEKIYLIYGDFQVSRPNILIQHFQNNLWMPEDAIIKNGNTISNLLTTLPPFGPKLVVNPKIFFDINGKMWITGNSLYRKLEDGTWKAYNAPRKEVNEDTTVGESYHELFFNRDNEPTVSSLITSNGLKYNGPRVNFFEIFKLENDTLRHTRIDNKIASLKTSSTHLVDESKMTVVNDTIVVYKPNGMFYFVNPDFSYDSTAFAGYDGKTSSNLEIRQIQPDGGLNKLWILADKSPTSTSEQCCSGLYLLENKKQWTLLDESNGMPKNNDGTFYSPRSIITLPNGNHLVAVSPDTNSGKFSMLYTIDESNKLTRVSLENLLNNAKVFPRRRFNRGITQELFTKIFTAIRTDTVTEPIPYTEILKIRLDGKGNLWWMMKDCIVMIPSFIPTSVVEENSSNDSLFVTPNPANTTISLSSVPPSCDKIEIVSIHGQIVQTEISGYENINIQSLPSGVYLLKMYTKHGIQTTTFVKEF